MVKLKTLLDRGYEFLEGRVPPILVGAHRNQFEAYVVKEDRQTCGRIFSGKKNEFRKYLGNLLEE